MATKKLLGEWYGYDRKVVSPDTVYKGDKIGLSSRSYRGYGTYKVSEYAMTAMMRKYYSSERQKAVDLYYPASDGLTDDDFLEWLDKNLQTCNNGTYSQYNWRSEQVISKKYLGDNYSLESVFIEFYKVDSNRSDHIFRAIELNEFIHRANPDQTLENFLLSDTEYQEKCKNFLIENYSKTTEDLINYSAPGFLRFGNRINQKTRKLLLPLTQVEMSKVLDYNNNPYYNNQISNSHTFEYTELFIKTALGETSKQEIKEIDKGEILSLILLEFMTGSKEYWNRIKDKGKLSSGIKLARETIVSIDYRQESFSRNFSYLISTGVLERLTPGELVAVVIGYEKSNRWADSSKGKTTLEIVTELMIENKLEPILLTKLIAHILMNDLHPISVETEFDWSDLTLDMPMEWIYETIPVSTRKKTLQKHPTLNYLK